MADRRDARARSPGRAGCPLRAPSRKPAVAIRRRLRLRNRERPRRPRPARPVRRWPRTDARPRSRCTRRTARTPDARASSWRGRRTGRPRLRRPRAPSWAGSARSPTVAAAVPRPRRSGAPRPRARGRLPSPSPSGTSSSARPARGRPGWTPSIGKYVSDSNSVLPVKLTLCRPGRRSPARVTRVQDEPAAADGDEPVLGLWGGASGTSIVR